MRFASSPTAAAVGLLALASVACGRRETDVDSGTPDELCRAGASTNACRAVDHRSFESLNGMTCSDGGASCRYVLSFGDSSTVVWDKGGGTSSGTVRCDDDEASLNFYPADSVPLSYDSRCDAVVVEGATYLPRSR